MTPSEFMIGGGSSSHAESSVDEEPVAAQLCFFCILLVLSFSCAHAAKKSCLSKWLPESLVVLLVGLGASLVLRLLEILGYESAATKFNVAWSSFTFFFVLLPPIVFSAAYHAKRGIFFRNAAPIGLLAIPGTLISNLVMTAGLYWAAELGLLGDVQFGLMELVAFGALLSSTDPVATLSVFSALKVDPNLFYTIFGESILNDAIAITAFRSANKYVTAAQESHSQRHELLLAGFLLDFFVTFAGSLVLGYALGIISALWFKRLDFVNHEHIATIGLMISFALLPYYAAECVGLSGIVTTLFLGISVRRYTKKNISLSAHLGSSFLFQLLSSIAEVSCFLLVGLNVVSVAALSSLHGRLILCTLVLCLVGRALSVYPLLSALNLVRLLRGGTHEPVNPHSNSITSSSTNTINTNTNTSSSHPDVISPMASSTNTNISACAAPHSASCTPSTPGIYDLSIRPPASAIVESQAAASPPAPSSLGNTLVPMRTMHMIFLSGLRGVVAFACAANFSDANGNLDVVVATTSGRCTVLLRSVLFECSSTVVNTVAPLHLSLLLP